MKSKDNDDLQEDVYHEKDQHDQVEVNDTELYYRLS